MIGGLVLLVLLVLVVAVIVLIAVLWRRQNEDHAYLKPGKDKHSAIYGGMVVLFEGTCV